MKLKKLALSLAILSTLSIGSQALAHGAWVAKIHGEQAVSYGHDGTNTDSYNPDKVKVVKGYKTDGSNINVTIKKHDNHASLEADDVAIYAVVFENGYYAQDKNGEWINKRGDQVEGAKSSAQYFKETVAYLNPRVKPITAGLTLEIVPAVNPAKLKVGEELKVQVLFEGKPLADAEVTSNYFDPKAEKVKTDKDGRASVKVANSTFNILGVSKKVESDDPFEGKGYMSTLTFEAKKEAEEN